MAFYLIDYENTKKISGCSALSEQDTIVFFYSQNANSLSFDLHKELCQTLAKKEYFLIRCGGKNALDFQLSSYVGYLVAKFPDENIYIVSQDKGFEYLLTFWENQHLALVQNIGEEEVQRDQPVAEVATPDAHDAMLDILKKNATALGLSKGQCNEIVRIFSTYKTRQAINNNLMKLFRDSDKVGRINKLIKPFLKGKK